MEKNFLIGKGKNNVYLHPQMCKQHGFIAGSPNSGKELTIQALAEYFSSIGVPVFLADIKGELSGLCEPGLATESTKRKLALMGINDYDFSSFPVQLWDISGKQGHHFRTTMSELGPLLLSSILGLTKAQSSTLHMVFKIADDQGLLLIDIKDLHAMLKYTLEADHITQSYELISKRAIRAIQRELIILEQNNLSNFFGEPVLNIHHLLKTKNRQGFINLLTAESLLETPTLYSAILTWLLADLHENLPQQNDIEKPRLIFFFNEAEVFFKSGSAKLPFRIERLLKQLYQKGIAVFFVVNSPLDIPKGILHSLPNKILHSLPGYTPSEQDTIKKVARIFRTNAHINFIETLPELNTGEALVSLLNLGGEPGIVEKAWITPPRSLIGAVSEARKQEVMECSSLNKIYNKSFDSDSAYERLQNYYKRSSRPRDKDINYKEIKTTPQKKKIQLSIRLSNLLLLQ